MSRKRSSGGTWTTQRSSFPGSPAPMSIRSEAWRRDGLGLPVPPIDLMFKPNPPKRTCAVTNYEQRLSKNRLKPKLAPLLIDTTVYVPKLYARTMDRHTNKTNARSTSVPSRCRRGGKLRPLLSQKKVLSKKVLSKKKNFKTSVDFTAVSPLSNLFQFLIQNHDRYDDVDFRQRDG